MQEISVLALMRFPGHPHVLQMIGSFADGGFTFLRLALFCSRGNRRGILYGVHCWFRTAVLILIVVSTVLIVEIV